MDNGKRHFTVLLMLIFWVTCINCNFQVTPPAKVSECVSKTITLTWTIESFMSAGIVSWNYNSTTLIMRQIGPTATPVPQGSYVGRVENGSNSDLIIKSPITSDTGGYQCSVTYNNGTEVLSDVVSLYIYDNWAVTLEITEKQNGQSATLTSNVDDPSVQQTWSNGAQGSSITVTEDGIYKLCISGGRAECLHPSSKNCTSYSLKIKACTGAFECGFCPILIVVVSSVIICILMWKEVPKRIGGFSTVKIVVIVIFSVVAIGIGLGLGLGLREGQNCLNCGATIGISISLGVALSAMQFAIIFKCNNEKECKDSKGVTSDRSNGNRARSPASASAVKVEAEKKSRNKPTEKRTEESSLHIKSYGSPLPEAPKVRHNKLDPIPKPDNGEMENSHNKPYTKLYGSPLPEVPQVRSNQLDPIQKQDIEEVESSQQEKKKKKKKKNRKKREDSVENEEEI